MKRKRFFRGLWRTLLLLLLALAVGIGVYSFNVRTFTGSRLPMPFGVGAAVVISGSMEPSLSVGDLIVVREADEYRIGQTVVFETGGSLVVHEIVRFEDGMVVTKGSANNTEDAPIPPKDIKGKVVFSIPFVGYVLDFIRSLPGTLAIIGLSLFLYLRSWRGEKNEDDEKRRALLLEIERLREQQDQDPKEK
jgi:signal peptidase